jgi:hypothetical protein
MIRFAHWLYWKLFLRVAMQRLPDFTVGGIEEPYLQRWWLLPRNRIFNAYLHCFMRSDDDRALHDHPWISLSLTLHGECIEHTIAAGGVRKQRWITSGQWRWRWARFAHRIELPAVHVFGTAAHAPPQPCWTLFLTGPVIRGWGFHCIDRGWVRWQDFTAPGQKGLVGKGCEQ